MPGDTRINSLIDHVEAMLGALENIATEAAQELESQNQGLAPDPHIISFVEDLRKRVHTLADLLEEDVINQLIGINNLLGPIQHLLKHSRKQDD